VAEETRDAQKPRVVASWRRAVLGCWNESEVFLLFGTQRS